MHSRSRRLGSSRLRTLVGGRIAARVIIGVCAPMLMVAAADLASAATVNGRVATQAPASNTAPSAAFVAACRNITISVTDQNSCAAAAVTDFNAVRAGEGVPPLRLPTGWAQLSTPLQLLVISNLERVDRGLAPAVGLVPSLNALAQQGALTDSDPQFPSPFRGTYGGANWAGAGNSALLDDYYWMYDDGFGSFNIGCRNAGDAGCWDHRNIILGAYASPLLMGAASVPDHVYGMSMTEEFIGGDTTDQPVAPLWNSLVAAGTGSSARTMPFRVLDTRAGIGAKAGRVPGKTTVVVHVPGLPPAASVVVLSVVAVVPSSNGFLAVYPGTSWPGTSNVNFSRGQTVTNTVMVPLDPAGNVSILNGSDAPTDLVADVTGYDTSSTQPGAYQPVAATRIVDTRNATGTAQAPISAPRGVLKIKVTGMSGVPAGGVSAVTLNIAAASPGGVGFAAVYPADIAWPGTSTLNLTPGHDSSNLAVVPVSADGYVDILDGTATPLNVVVDVAGYYRAGTSSVGYGPVTPFRVLDTRVGVGAPQATIASHATIRVKVTGSNGIPATGVTAVIMNLTGLSRNAFGFLAAYPDGITWPGTSSLNFTPDSTVTNLVVVPVSTNGYIDVLNGSTGPVDAVGDVSGYVLS